MLLLPYQNNMKNWRTKSTAQPSMSHYQPMTHLIIWRENSLSFQFQMSPLLLPLLPWKCQILRNPPWMFPPSSSIYRLRCSVNLVQLPPLTYLIHSHHRFTIMIMVMPTPTPFHHPQLYSNKMHCR